MLSTSSDLGGLFGDGAGAAAARGGKRGRAWEEPAEGRRVMLKPYDTVAAQFLNPYGASILDASSLPEIWRAVSEGSKAAMFHTELAALDDTGGALPTESMCAGRAGLRPGAVSTSELQQNAK